MHLSTGGRCVCVFSLTIRFSEPIGGHVFGITRSGTAEQACSLAFVFAGTRAMGTAPVQQLAALQAPVEPAFEAAADAIIADFRVVFTVARKRAATVGAIAHHNAVGERLGGRARLRQLAQPLLLIRREPFKLRQRCCAEFSGVSFRLGRGFAILAGLCCIRYFPKAVSALHRH